MTRLLLALAVVGACLVPPSVARAAGTVRLDGVLVRLQPGTAQVVTVNHTGGHHARVTLWRLADGRWEQRLQVEDGRIGYGGLVAGDRRRQGTGTTPIGTYPLPWAFGTHDPDEAWDLRYREIRRGDFWVQDNRSAHYNRYRNQRDGGFRWWLPASDINASERLTDFRRQYEWSIVIGFNAEQVRYRGAGIFLHVNGRGATAGCVSAPRAFIRTLMRRLDPDLHPLIAIGR
ncbi:L,D-transpeptidase family protein [Nocardioides sp. MAH-18]|uniref:L,D-transpeptidase family protein n=1 Tax=Nocardioides agri TaxID=2682843 RepID=A0A6L6XW61_9ACTN|nr:L,D-transpeptidase family protein [Nocardioides sp. CGMCC 1.13656]MBA2956101.1 L,D-transpeptidase family protein [Nocardioides sp. CGMCC 1.13656]MVQ50947.1 L,D-transpeptidase family protein [Nocardioides sp. MAH-18]